MSHDLPAPLHAPHNSNAVVLLADADEPVEAQPSTPRSGRSILALLRGRYHWAVILALLFGVPAGIAGYFYVQPMYMSVGQIRINPDPRAAFEGVGDSGVPPYFDSYMDVQAARLYSEPVVSAALQSEAWQRLRPGEVTDSDIRIFTRKMDVERARRGQTIDIAYEDKDPMVASVAVRAIIDAFRKEFRNQTSQEDAQILSSLRSMHAQRTAELNSLQDQLKVTAGPMGPAGLKMQYEAKQQELWRTQNELRQLELQIQLVGQSSQEPADPLNQASIAQIEMRALSDPYLNSLWNQKRALEAELASHRQFGRGDNHVRVRQVQAQLDAVNSQIDRYLRDHPMQPTTPGLGLSSSGAPVSLAELQARQQMLNQYQQELEAEVSALGQKHQALTQLEGKIEVAQQELRDLSVRIDRITAASTGPERIDVISYGGLPSTPYNLEKRYQLAALAAMAGAGMGVGLVMLLGLMDTRLRTIDETQSSLPAVRMLGILPSLPENLASPEQMAIAAHCVHHIRTLLQLGSGRNGRNGHAQSQGGRVFVITSPAAGSGKTSLTSALGISFASSGAKTLLIDCDLVGSGLSRRLGATSRRPVDQVLRQQGLITEQALREARHMAEASHQPLEEILITLGHLKAGELERVRRIQRESQVGLLEACDGEPLEACVAEAGFENLMILPVGEAQPNQAGVLSPASIRRLLDEARRHFDVVVVDTGPILGSIEASMASASADGAVLVISRGDVKPMVNRSLEHLRSIQAPIAGIVFNHALDHDVERSSYASVASVPSRPMEEVVQPVDEATSARLGPVGAAVVGCAPTLRRAARGLPRNGNRIDPRPNDA